MPCPARSATSSTPLEPRATLAVLPPPDGSPTCRSRREECLRALAITCGTTMEEAVHRHCSAGRFLVPPGRAPDQPPEKSLTLVPASAGRQPGGGGNGPVAGRLADTGKGVAFKRRPGAPGSSTQGQARVGECRTPFQAARVRAARGGMPSLSDADTIRRSSGLRADCATPCMRLACTRIQTFSPEASARARPSGPGLPFQTPAVSRAGMDPRCAPVTATARSAARQARSCGRIPRTVRKRGIRPQSPLPLGHAPPLAMNVA